MIYKTATIVELTHGIMGEKRELGIVVGYSMVYYHQLRLTDGNELDNWFCFVGYNYDLFQEVRRTMNQEATEKMVSYSCVEHKNGQYVKPYIYQFGETLQENETDHLFKIDKIEFYGSKGKAPFGQGKYVVNKNKGYMVYLKRVNPSRLHVKVVNLEELEKNYKVV